MELITSITGQCVILDAERVQSMKELSFYHYRNRYAAAGIVMLLPALVFVGANLLQYLSGCMNYGEKLVDMKN